MTHNIQGENIVQWSLCKFLDGYLVVPFLVFLLNHFQPFFQSMDYQLLLLKPFSYDFLELCAKQDLMMWDLD